MKTDKIIIFGDLSNMFDKDLYYDFLNFVADIKKWEKEQFLDMKLAVSIYETQGDTAISSK